MSGNLNQETNKLKDEVNKRELHFLRTGDPRPEPQVDKVADKLEENQGKGVKFIASFLAKL